MFVTLSLAVLGLVIGYMDTCNEDMKFWMYVFGTFVCVWVVVFGCTCCGFELLVNVPGEDVKVGCCGWWLLNHFFLLASLIWHVGWLVYGCVIFFPHVGDEHCRLMMIVSTLLMFDQLLSRSFSTFCRRASSPSSSPSSTTPSSSSSSATGRQCSRPTTTRFGSSVRFFVRIVFRFFCQKNQQIESFQGRRLRLKFPSPCNGSNYILNI